MDNKQHAIEQINGIYAAMQRHISVMLPGGLLIAIGTGIMFIPLVEMALHRCIDPILLSMGANNIIIFLLRTAFYWTSFTLLSKCFARDVALHPAIKRAWGLNSLYPLIPVTTAGMLALTGHTDLIMPIILILVGLFWSLIGRFTSPIITTLAVSNILLGIGSIYLSILGISNLWMYLLMFQGASCLVAGITLRMQQHSLTS